MMNRFLIILCLSILFHINSFSQKSKFTNEIGFDLHTIMNQFSRDNHARKKFELIYKIISKKRDWRLKIYKEEGNYRGKDIPVNYVLYTDLCIDGRGYETTYTYSHSFGLNIGYVKKLRFKKSEFYYGIDGKLQLNKGRVNIYKEFCDIRPNGAHAIGFGLWKGNQNNDKTIGIIPIAGIKTHFKRLVFSLECGLPLNHRFGERIYYDINFLNDYGEIPFKESYLDQRLINDLSITFLF